VVTISTHPHAMAAAASGERAPSPPEGGDASQLASGSDDGEQAPESAPGGGPESGMGDVELDSLPPHAARQTEKRSVNLMGTVQCPLGRRPFNESCYEGRASSSRGAK
jgi:hypothetical protein